MAKGDVTRDIKKIGILIIVALFLLVPFSALAQSYSFSLDRAVVDVYVNADGTLDLMYHYTFSNDPGAAWIDFVDIGLPNQKFNENAIIAEANGQPAAYVSSSEYQGDGTGVAIALGSSAIPPGSTGELYVYIPGVERMIHPDSQDKGYASTVFSPTWFGSEFVHGNTDMQVTFHLPPGVQPQEPRWHKSPSGWATEPIVDTDGEGRVTYTWRNARANGYTQYKFGASVPRAYLPAAAVITPTILERLNISSDALIGWLVGLGFFFVFAGSTVIGFFNSQRRRMQYLPPKITVEGHGIKRGLTAIEAAILMEQPLDKVLTMILFSVIKKNAARVKTKDPLELEIAQPAPEGLNSYEGSFLKAFRETEPESRKKELRETMVTLIKSVGTKMKGFSYKETLAYYRSIVEEAWKQVESASTPEIKSAAFEENLDWTMLDRNYDDRTRRTFEDQPVYMPSWWDRYDPSPAGRSPGHASTGPATSGGGSSLPTLPGSDFAASMVNGVQGFSANVIGGLGAFTSSVTGKTNPVATSSGGVGSSGGGCACACAGCACACAGGGR